MNIWLWALAFILGFIGGMFTMACCVCAGRADEEIERACRERELIARGKVKDEDTRGMVEIVDDCKRGQLKIDGPVKH